jgi:hypothetical protein
MAAPKVPRDLRKLVKAYKAKGWQILPAGSGHVKWTSPTGEFVTTTSSSPRNPHGALKQTMRHLAHYEKAVAA